MKDNIFKPLVSIIIPVYNGSNYMKEAIDSALAQSYENIEVILVNDGSNDHGLTRGIALSYGDKIKYFEKVNGGVASALNTGLRNMKGEYFSWLSHDDVYYPNKIETQIKYLHAVNEKVVILYSDFDRIDEHSKIYKTNKIKHYNPDIFFFELLKLPFLHGCTLLVPKICFETIGYFREDLITTQDYDLWYKMALKYDFIHQGVSLVKSRDHAEQGSKTLYHFEELDNLYLENIDRINLEKYEKAAARPGDSYIKELYIIFNNRKLLKSRDKLLKRYPVKVSIFATTWSKMKYALFLILHSWIKKMVISIITFKNKN